MNQQYRLLEVLAPWGHELVKYRMGGFRRARATVSWLQDIKDTGSFSSFNSKIYYTRCRLMYYL